MIVRQQGEGRVGAMDEAQLLCRLLRGEQMAYCCLVKTHQGSMRAVASLIAGRRHVDDVVQEAWLAIVKGLAGFRGQSSLRTWMLTITANRAKCRYVQEMRKGDERFCPQAERWLAGPAGWHEDTPEALAGEDELRLCLEKALHELSPLQSNALILRDRVGFELDEIAEVLGVSRPNARVLVHRARMRVFAAVERYQQCVESEPLVDITKKQAFSGSWR